MRRLAIVVVALFSTAGVGFGIAAAASAPDTGTNVACATATAVTPDHTVGVDGADVHTITGASTTAAQCETQTYTIPTVTQTDTATVTQTVTAIPTSTSSSTSTTSSTTTSTTSSGPPPPPGCTTTVTPATLTSSITTAAAGDVLCLASGSYGTWSGTSKAITLTAAAGATPAMTFNFGSGDSGFTLDGITATGGQITAGAKNITISRSQFTSPVVITGLANANVTFNHDTFEPQQDNSSCTSEPAQVHLAYSNGTTPSGVTVENSTFLASSAQGNNPRQGIQDGASMVVRDNVFNGFANLSGCNHIDSIQLYGGENTTITGNLFENGYDGAAAFDGTAQNTVTDNACVNLTRGDCITLYSDNGSVVNHNTAVGAVNVVELDHKSADPAGKGTVVENNIGTLNVSDGSTMAVDTNNLYAGAKTPDLAGTPTFQGGKTPSSWSGFLLASGSAGVSAATDGSDVGIRASAGGPPSS